LANPRICPNRHFGNIRKHHWPGIRLSQGAIIHEVTWYCPHLTKLIPVLSLMLFTTALGSVFDQAFVPLSKNPLFLYIYIIVAAIAAVAAILFWYFYRHYNKEDDDMNGLDKTSTNIPVLNEKVEVV
jgi:hypothetical protein